MHTIPSLLESRLRAALTDFPGAEPKVVAAADTRFGDYQTNAAMVLAKQARANPRQLAQQIIDKLHVSDLCAPPEIAGAGFINFRLKPEALAARFVELARDERLGVPTPVQPRTLVIDFGGPNVAKPMHIGHIRSTILGAALARTAEFLGHRVVRDNHVGDWGTQFGMLLVGWKTMLDREALARDPIAEMERLYRTVNATIQNEVFNPAVKFPGKEGTGGGNEPIGATIRGRTPTEKAVADELVKLQGGDEENLAIWREMLRLSQSQFDAIFSRLGVRFDVTLGESFYNPWLREVVADLTSRGIARESDGAMCVFSDRSGPEKDDPFLISRDGQWVDIPALVQKADGAANYTTTDLATLDYRLREWAPDEIVYVTDGRQQLHFRQVFAIFRRWKPDAKTKLAHVWFGTILGENGKPFKTRSGDTVKLADLLDEAEERAFALVSEKNPTLDEAERREIARMVGLGAVKYADLLPNRQSDYVFSWEKMLSFQGNTAPYLQYSHVRIRSIFRRAAEQGAGSGEQGAVVLEHDAELALAKKLGQFGEVVPQVLDDHRPNILANYLYELAATFHSFFESCPVLKSEGATQATRLALCDATARVLAKGLALLGIEAPERM